MPIGNAALTRMCRSGEGDRSAKSGGAGGTASCRGYRGGAPNPCAAALFPQTSLRVRSTEDEDSPKGYRSPKPTTLCGAGRKALFAGNSGQLWVFRQTGTGDAPQRRIPRLYPIRLFPYALPLTVISPASALALPNAPLGKRRSLAKARMFFRSS